MNQRCLAAGATDHREWTHAVAYRTSGVVRRAGAATGLDRKGVGGCPSAGRAGLFDLVLANELYAALLAPVETLVKDKRALLVVLSGALVSQVDGNTLKANLAGLTGTVGTCTPVAANNNPVTGKTTCTATAQASCGLDGKCHDSAVGAA